MTLLSYFIGWSMSMLWLSWSLHALPGAFMRKGYEKWKAIMNSNENFYYKSQNKMNNSLRKLKVTAE